jgi:hypothetical protein
MYQPRTYRNEIKDGGLASFTVAVKETDLYIRADRDLTLEAQAAIHEVRRPLEEYIRGHPLFLHSLEPVEVENGAAEIVRVMAEAARLANVGPMAAVAGAVAELVGRKLLAFSQEVIVENGGDIFLKVNSKRQIGIYAGGSEFTGKLAIEVGPGQTRLGICTSSGTVGPSLSLGLADAAIILAPSAALADAAATAVGNVVKGEQDIDAAIELGKQIKGINGIVVIVGSNMGAWGDIKLVKT